MDDGAIGSRWSGVYESDDGRFAILWSERLSFVGLPGELTIEEEVIGSDGTSNWAEVVPPEPDPEEKAL